MAKKYFFNLILLLYSFNSIFAQLDYSNMTNWAFHPSKLGTLIDGFNLNIAVIDENLNTTSVISNTNNAMTNTGVDVFFIHPTILENMGSYTTIENIPIASQNSILVQASIRGQAGLLAKYGRLFAPRYQQATPPTFINSPTDTNQATVLGVAYNDVKAAFLNYLTNYNNGNKIIIASHSQGSYYAGFLLRDVFDNNPQLRQKLVVAAVTGIITNYSDQNSTTGGWWQNIPFCTQQSECGCVMNWRSFKEGQNPPGPISSHPSFNPTIVSNNWANSLLNLSQDWVYQDNLYYTDTYSSLQNFITLRNTVNFGGAVGYVAFNDLYQIKHLRTSATQVGFVVQHTPKPNEQRPNLLLDEETNPLFSSLGYHQKDYNLYTWALIAQIDQKLNCTTLSASNFNSSKLIFYPNPAKDWVFIKDSGSTMANESVIISDFTGKILISGILNEEAGISIENLPTGLYFLKTKFGIHKLMVYK